MRSGMLLSACVAFAVTALDCRAAQWTPTRGPYAYGSVQFAVADEQGEHLYAVYGQRVYVSTDAGEHWRAVNTVRDARLSGYDLEVEPGHPNVLYMAAGQVLRSGDGGATWRHYGPDELKDRVFRLAVHPAEPGVVYAGRNREGVWRVDGERGELLLAQDLCFDYDHSLYVDPEDPRVIRVSARAGPASEGPGWWRTRDGGKTWMHETRSGVWSEWFSFLLPIERERWGARVRVCAGNPRRVFRTGSDGLCRSDDGGESWALINKGLGASWLFCVCPMPTEDGVIVASPSPEGVFRTTDGGKTWTQCPLDIGWPAFAQIVAHPRVPRVLFAVTSAVPNRNARDAVYLHRIMRSTDSGRTWQEVYLGEPADAKDPNHFNSAFSFDEHRDNVIRLCTASGILGSTDGGATWELLWHDETPGDRRELQVLFATGSAAAYWDLKARTIRCTPDWGDTWWTSRMPSLEGGFTLAVGHPDDPTALYLLHTYGGWRQDSILWVTRGGSQEWEGRRLPTVETAATSIARSPTEPDTLAVGFNDGSVWLSRDDGATWEALGEGIPPSWILRLAFSPADNRLYAFALNEGLFCIELAKQD